MTNFQGPIKEGSPLPLGTLASKEGVNIAFHAKTEKASITLFQPDKDIPCLIIPLDPITNKTKDTWHVFIKDLTPPFEYSIQVDQENRMLIDPYAKALSSSSSWGDLYPLQVKSRCLPQTVFDWEGAKKPLRPFKDWIIYEMHVRAFTIHPSSKTAAKGTFLGIIEKIPHLLSLGVNTIELLPVHEFNERDNPRKNPLTGESLYNFWGYSTVNFFSLMQRYATSNTGEEYWNTPIKEFKTMVKELHKNGIAVILDVVYNHTAEAGKDGEVQSFKGLDKDSYYLFDKNGGYCNYTGTGNTVNCNNPVTSQLIVDSLCYFSNELQVDGFRFDLASIFTRGENGEPLQEPPLIKQIEEEPLLQDAQFIAEAWDAVGLYQVGSFPGKERWAEWNGEYRDSVRRFLKGDTGQSGKFAKALCGSQNLYWKDSPTKSINFVTAHDGFSLYDLVSYENKHNLGNGENNQDGANDNASWNCGVEGETKDPLVLFLRSQQIKNFALALMVSLGVPMILMGDEYGHTKKGNNNTYCQDNELNWFLWNVLEKKKELFRFFKKILQFRNEKKHLFCKETFLTEKDILWHGKEPLSPNWSEENHLIVYTLIDHLHNKDCLIAFNAGSTSVTINIPSPPIGKSWKLIINTSLTMPHDFVENGTERCSLINTYLLKPRSAILAELDH